MTEEAPNTPRRPPAEFAAQKQRGRPFTRGQSGNPKGKPKGARNLTARTLDELAAGAGERVVKRLIARASRSDTAAAAILARIWPPPRGRTVTFKLPTISSAGDAAQAVAYILKAAAAGVLTPDEADHFISMAERYSKLLEAAELERRVSALERLQPAPLAARPADDDANEP